MLTFYCKKGFTLIELMIVIAIIGIISAIAIPQFNAYKQRSYNSAALSDARHAYTAAQAFFSENSSGTASSTNLSSYGYNQTFGVNISIGGTITNLAITANHSVGTKTYSVDWRGMITNN